MLLSLVIGGVVGSQAFPRVEARPETPIPCLRAVWALSHEVAASLEADGMSIDNDAPEGLGPGYEPIQLREAYERTANACITHDYPTNNPKLNPDPGILTVEVTRQCCFMEGSQLAMKVDPDAGVIHRDLLRRHRVRVTLEPGTYSIVTYETPTTGPVTSRCEQTLLVEPGGVYQISLTTGPNIDGCHT
jgi:hypothetical protein